MVEITWSEDARENLIDIFDFISKDSIHYANKEIQLITNRVKILQGFPMSGKIVPEIKKENVRELIEGSYRIVYEIFSEHAITILTVHHSSKLLK
ncbi:MAG: type II toxin-antitoxin system RelE/ParE family toxin [Bacteroidota bacterium]